MNSQSSFFAFIIVNRVRVQLANGRLEGFFVVQKDDFDSRLELWQQRCYYDNCMIDKTIKTIL